MYLIIILYIICASMFTLSKLTLAYAPPIFFVALRMILAGFLLYSYTIVKYKYFKTEKILINTYRDWWLFAQIILFHVYLTYVCDLCALKDITSIESAFLYNLSPFVAALFSYYWFNEKMTLKKWIGLLLGLSSMIPFFGANVFSSLSSFGLSTSLYPRFLTLIAVVSSTYGWIVLRELVNKRGYSPVFVNGFGMLLGGLFALITSYWTESWSYGMVSSWVYFIQLTIVLIVIANIIFYNLYGFLLKKYTATFLSFAGIMCPVFAAVFGWMFLGESIGLNIIISFAIVCLGLYIFYQEELRQGYIKNE